MRPFISGEGPQAEEIGERAVHVLAQLDDGASLRVAASSGQSRLQRLAVAYGIADRLEFGGPATAASDELSLDDRLGGLRRTAIAELIHDLTVGTPPHATRRGDDSILRDHRVVFITNRPAHYRVALMNRIDARLAAVGARFRVLFTSADPWSRPWMRPGELLFDHRFLRSRSVTDRSRDLPFDLETQLMSFDPTIIVTAGFWPAVTLRAAAFARIRRCPIGIFSGEVPWHAITQSRLSRLARAGLLRTLSFGIAYGHASAEHLRTLAPQLPIVYGRNTTETPADPRPFDDRDTLEVLAIGQAIPRKGLDVAVDACKLIADVPARLTVIGEGPELRRLIRRAEGNQSIRFLGGVPSDRILDAYRDSDVFLFPTREDVFGLALVEAMGSGLPTIVSEAPGAIADLAAPDRNCLVVSDHRPEAWARSLRDLVADRDERQRLGEAACATVVRRWTLDHSVDAWIAGFRLGVLVGQQRTETAASPAW